MSQENKPCTCDDEVKFLDTSGQAKIRCFGCNSEWELKSFLTETATKVKRSEARRRGRALTCREAHSIDDQCYFMSLPPGTPGPSGGVGPN